MTTNDFIMVRRINENMMIVGDKIVKNDNGLWLTIDSSPLGDDKIKAIFRFIKNEKQALELSVTVSVRSLLDELGISYQIR